MSSKLVAIQVKVRVVAAMKVDRGESEVFSAVCDMIRPYTVSLVRVEEDQRRRIVLLGSGALVRVGSSQ